MRTLDPASSLLLLIDLQERLLPAIEGGAAVLANARRLLDAARLLGVPVLVTEQNPRGLGATVPDLAGAATIAPTIVKTSFDALRAPGLLERLPEGVVPVVAGCEAHVCVLQTVLGLLDARGRAVVVGDAVGSRRAESRDAALRRMERHGAEVVTAEMAIFEWLGTSDHPRFREALALVR
jgi:nicotinamidase-related amidase